MTISYTHNFIFVHLGKTAGSSMRNALLPFASSYPRDPWSKLRSRIGWVSDYKQVYFPVHADCNYISKRLPKEVYDSMFKFAFVRNPWDMLVSSYHYILRNEAHHRHKRVKSLGSFHAFVRYETERNKFHQHMILTDAAGNYMVDYVGRFETLLQDFNLICDRIGVETNLPHDNKSKHKPYTSYYDDSTRTHVEKCWARDIELFGYTFEGFDSEVVLPGQPSS